MDQTTQNPQAPEVTPPAANAQNSDLYMQIASSDNETQVVKKKSKSPLMALVVWFMRMTLYVDSLRRSNEVLFRVLKGIWVAFMGLLYLCGIAVLVFAVYERLQLPVYLEDELHTRGIEFENAEYTTDRAIVRNLRDKEGHYIIDTMVIYSSFTDLLQHRIRSVTIDGLNILLDEKSEFNMLNEVPSILSELQNPVRGKLGLKVNALTVNNAKFSYKDRQMDIPVSFSMEGIYGDKTQIVIPMTINQPNLKAKGTLTVGGSKRQPEWLLTVTEGSVSLPRSSPENIAGTLKITLKKNVLDSVSGDFKLGYGTIVKHITGWIKKGSNDKLNLSVVWEKNNLTEPSLSSDLSFGVDDISFGKNGRVMAQGKFLIDSKTFVLPDVRLTNFHTSLPVEMLCVDWTNCMMRLNSEATVSIDNLWFEYQKIPIRSKETVQFSLLPSDKFLSIGKNDPYMTFNFNIKNLLFDGEIETTGQSLSLDGKNIGMDGSLVDVGADGSKIQLSATGLTFTGSDMKFEDASVEIDNVLQKTTKSKISAQNMQLSGLPVLSRPFSVRMNMVDTQATAQLDFDEGPVTMLLEGQFLPLQKTFSGKVYVKPFDLQELTVPVQSFWPDLPVSFTNVSGQVAALGRVDWQGPHGISGPINVGFKNLSFSTEKTNVTNLNGVVLFETLSPVSTAHNQHLVVQSIDSLIPFQDLDMIFEVENQNLHLNQLSVIGAGIPLSLPASIVATKSSNVLLYLKNTVPITAEQFERAVRLNDIDVSSGTANLTIPLEIQNSSLSIPNITLKITNTLLKREDEAFSDVFDLEKNYFVRTGQIILNKDKVLQIVLNGRLLPSKKAKDVQLNDVKLPDDFFAPLAKEPVPKDIQDKLNALFQE